MTLEVMLKLCLAHCWYCWVGTVPHVPETGFEPALFDQYSISASAWLLHSVWKLCDSLLVWLLDNLNVTPTISTEVEGFFTTRVFAVRQTLVFEINKHGCRTIRIGNACINNCNSFFLFWYRYKHFFSFLDYQFTWFLMKSCTMSHSLQRSWWLHTRPRFLFLSGIKYSSPTYRNAPKPSA